MRVENHSTAATRAASEAQNKQRSSAEFEASDNRGDQSDLVSEVAESVLAGLADFSHIKPKKSMVNRMAAFQVWREMQGPSDQDGKQIDRAWGFEGTKEELEEFRQWYRDNKGPDASWNDLAASLMEELSKVEELQDAPLSLSEPVDSPLVEGADEGMIILPEDQLTIIGATEVEQKPIDAVPN